MKIGTITHPFADLGLEEMLAKCKEIGVEQVELGCGNWAGSPHVDVDGLLESEAKREEMKELLDKYGISIAAFNCSGNPLAPGAQGKEHTEVIRKTIRLSELFGLNKIVSMSGCPGAGPDAVYPNWIITSWPPETQQYLDYQWNECAIPFWKEMTKYAEDHGVTRIALEPHGCQLVHDMEGLLRLREATSETIGLNLDPSHLFWMGADPISIARTMGDMIYHVHIKDVRIEKPSQLNTLLDGKDVLEYAKRSWNFSIPGYGHDERWWREFLVTLKMVGYDDVLSIEHEDYSMDTLLGVKKTVDLLKANMV